MDLISLLILIAIIGVIAWAITTYVPMPPMFKNMVVLVAILAVCLFVLSLFAPIPSIHVGR